MKIIETVDLFSITFSYPKIAFFCSSLEHFFLLVYIKLAFCLFESYLDEMKWKTRR